MHRVTPLGLYDAPSRAEGVAPYAGSAIPGPLGTRIYDASSRLGVDSNSPLAELGRAADVTAFFTVGSETYRLLRIDTEWRQGVDELRVPPEQAVAIIERAARQHQRNPDAVHLFETAVSQLAGLHQNGVFVLLQRQRYDRSGGSAAQTAASSTPSAFRPPAPPELPPSVEEPVMGSAQAVALKNAAAAGVPFCEECARAAAARGGTATAA